MIGPAELPEDQVAKMQPQRPDATDIGIEGACAALRERTPFSMCGDTLLLRFRLSDEGFDRVDAVIDEAWPE